MKALLTQIHPSTSRSNSRRGESRRKNMAEDARGRPERHRAAFWDRCVANKGLDSALAANEMANLKKEAIGRRQEPTNSYVLRRASRARTRKAVSQAEQAGPLHKKETLR